jgi:hypothetical protein
MTAPVFRYRYRLATVLAVLATLLEAAEALARAGGGHSYSGGGGGHSGGGGGDGVDGEIIRLVIWLVFRYPQVGIPVVVAGGVVYFIYVRKSRLPAGFSTGAENRPLAGRTAATVSRSSVRLPAVPLLIQDPQFSLPLFIDFASSLAQRSLTALNTAALVNLAPYISADAFAAFPAGVVLKNVVVGSVSVNSLVSASGSDQITVAVSFCATAVNGSQSETFWCDTQWFYRRRAGVVSKGPAEMLKMACPSCGATSDKDAAGACAYCGARPAPGNEIWTVVTVKLLSRESRPPVDLGSYAEEKGTMLPTVYSPTLNTGLVGIANWDTNFDREQAMERFRRIFIQMQEAWSRRDLAAIRPLVTDQLYRVYCYWIEAYRAAGIRNEISNTVIVSLETVAADIDPFYDSMTVRIGATMVDRCIDERGTVVGGDSNPRRFSEYWTFVRIAGGKATADPVRTCSGCGAEIQTGMSGECAYCGMLVSGRNFDWVLSRIDQDEDYGQSV